jgi:hypothetical protein
MLDKIKVGHSPLSDSILLYRMGKDPLCALESKDVTNMVLGAAVEHLMHDAPNGSHKTIRARREGQPEQAWEMTVVPVVDWRDKEAKDTVRRTRTEIGKNAEELVSGTNPELRFLEIHGKFYDLIEVKV